MMNADAINRLTDREREMLMLVAEGYQSKEIARRTNLSVGRVNNIIEAARGRLGGITRVEAARIVRQHAARKGVHPLHGQRLHVPDHKSDAAAERDQSPAAQSEVRENRAIFTVTDIKRPPARSTEPDDLTPAKMIERTFQLVVIITLIAVLIQYLPPLFKTLRGYILRTFY